MYPNIKRRLRSNRTIRAEPYAACLALLLVADRMEYEVSQLLRTERLTTAQYNVLRILRGAGGQGHPCNAISCRLVKPVPDLTRVLDRLEERGLVKRERQAEDRRVVRVRITDTGLEILDRLDPPIAELHTQQFKAITPEECEQLVSLLDRLIPGLPAEVEARSA